MAGMLASVVFFVRGQQLPVTIRHSRRRALTRDQSPTLPVPEEDIKAAARASYLEIFYAGCVGCIACRCVAITFLCLFVTESSSIRALVCLM